MSALPSPSGLQLVPIPATPRSQPETERGSTTRSGKKPKQAFTPLHAILTPKRHVGSSQSQSGSAKAKAKMCTDVVPFEGPPKSSKPTPTPSRASDPVAPTPSQKADWIWSPSSVKGKGQAQHTAKPSESKGKSARAKLANRMSPKQKANAKAASPIVYTTCRTCDEDVDIRKTTQAGGGSAARICHDCRSAEKALRTNFGKQNKAHEWKNMDLRKRKVLIKANKSSGSGRGVARKLQAVETVSVRAFLSAKC